MSKPAWKTYACRYYHSGKWWGLDLSAQSNDDAEARVRKLGNLQLLGEVKATIAAGVPGAGLLAKTITSLRNSLFG
ncbi:MAG TPA: hypothetical protein VGM62_17265 [Chthoniobacterales bacterium]|jgi:hypothetical protein